jgi:acetyltransferase-like isoleucine patch superfamily enzyme
MNMNDGKQNSLSKFTNIEINNFNKSLKFGRLNPILKKILYSIKRLYGSFSYDDQIKIACCCEPPLFFLNNGIMIPHPYGITLSIDEIGCDVSIAQNVTLGANGNNIEFGETTANPQTSIRKFGTDLSSRHYFRQN